MSVVVGFGFKNNNNNSYSNGVLETAISIMSLETGFFNVSSWLKTFL